MRIHYFVFGAQHARCWVCLRMFGIQHTEQERSDSQGGFRKLHGRLGRREPRANATARNPKGHSKRIAAKSRMVAKVVAKNATNEQSLATPGAMCRLVVFSSFMVGGRMG